MYLLGLGRLAQVEDGNWEWFLGDALGSVRQVVDGDGAVMLARDYAPFGLVRSESGTGSSGYGFTGEQGTVPGLIYLRARLYDPYTGRFISRDPFPGYTGLPQTQHPYAYCLNNAVNCTDPSGNMPPDEVEGLLHTWKIGAYGLKAWNDLNLFLELLNVPGATSIAWKYGGIALLEDIPGMLSGVSGAGGAESFARYLELLASGGELVDEFGVDDEVVDRVLGVLGHSGGQWAHSASLWRQTARIMGGVASAIQLAEGGIGLYHYATDLNPCMSFWDKYFGRDYWATTQRLKALSASLKVASGATGLLALSTSFTGVGGALFGTASVLTGVSAAALDLYVGYREGELAWMGLEPAIPSRP